MALTHFVASAQSRFWHDSDGLPRRVKCVSYRRHKRPAREGSSASAAGSLTSSWPGSSIVWVAPYSAARASPPTWRTAARSKRCARWLRASRPAPPSFTIGVKTASRLMKWKKLLNQRILLVGQIALIARIDARGGTESETILPTQENSGRALSLRFLAAASSCAPSWPTSPRRVRARPHSGPRQVRSGCGPGRAALS
jgi:hypothetical protein